MNRQDGKWVEDVEDLLQRSVLEEATQKIMNVFETALSSLDANSAELLRRHFDGVSAETLSREKNISADQMKAWLSQAKRQVMDRLRREFSIRQ